MTVTLRSTPRYQYADERLFPALTQREREIRVPHYPRVELRRIRAYVSVDAFFVPEPLRVILETTYDQAVRIWWRKGGPRKFPKGGVTLPGFHDWVGLLMPTEYAPWWIRTLEACAPYCFNKWELDGKSKLAAYARWAETPLDLGPLPWAHEGG